MYTKLNNRNNIWRKFAETNLISGKLLLQFFNLIQSLALKREARRVEAKEFETKQHSVFGNALFLFHTIISLLDICDELFPRLDFKLRCPPTNNEIYSSYK